MNQQSLVQKVRELAQQFRGNQLNFNRLSYSLGLLHSVYQAKVCDINHITVVELGVANGNGLESIIKTAQFLEKQFDIKFNVVGFDLETGLPHPKDFRDHPEIWQSGQFQAREISEFCKNNSNIVFGDLADTLPSWCNTFQGTLGWVSVDVDFYSSTKSAWPLFKMDPERYLPATPMHVDDINVDLLYNPWCGEGLALKEFNDCHNYRKIEEKSRIWNIENFHVLHVLDHPWRQGTKQPPRPISITVI